MHARSTIIALLCTAGCVEDVMLAGECPPGQPGECLRELDASAEVPVDEDDPLPAERVDSGTPPRDVMVVAAPDAASSLPSYPALGNPSFEFETANGEPGGITTVNDLITTTSIAPWFTCQPVSGTVSNSVTAVRAETSLTAGTKEGEPKTDVGPRDGAAFISIGYLVNIVPVPLLQQLPEPLHAGERYAFAIDALATSNAAMLSLEVRGNDEGCFGPTAQRSLFKSAPITSPSWTTICVEFTPGDELAYLILAAEPNLPDSVIDPASMLFEGDILGGPRLMFDRIRMPAPGECPGF